MGIGTSKHAAAATEEMKERLGVFELGRKEKYAGNLLSLILSQMLEENRFFNIMELLGENGGCFTLFMVVQSTVEREFLRLKIPDPERSSTVTSVVSVPQSIYKSRLESRPSRAAICNNISHFLVRLITLIAALTASIKTNQTMKGLISTDSEQKEPGQKYKDLDDSQLDVVNDKKRIIPDFLIKQGVFIEDQNNKYIIPNSSYVIQADKMIIYNADKNVTLTNVYKIIFEKTDYKLPETQRKTSPQSMSVQQKGPSVGTAGLGSAGLGSAGLGSAGLGSAGLGSAGMGTAGMGTAFGIGAGMGTSIGAKMGMGPQIRNNSTYISEKTVSDFAGQSTVASRRRHSTRRLRKLPRRRSRRQFRQWGGQTVEQTTGQPTTNKSNLQKVGIEGTEETRDTLYKVTISPIAPTPGPVIDFLLNSGSETYETNEVRAYDQIRQSPFPKSEALYNRISKLFQTEGRFKVAFPAPSKPDESKKEFMTLHSKATLEKIKSSMKKLNEGSATGTAPAPYRAFLLATETSGSEIGHLLCSDKWSGQWLTSVMAYSLLQSLFNDTIDEKMTLQSAEACRAMMNDFIKTGAVYASSETEPLPTSFNNLRFQELPGTLKQSVCQQTTVLKTESLPENVAILKKAHHDLRLLYEAYVDKIFAFTQTIVKPYRTEKDGKLDYIFKIDPAFFTTEGTSQEYLEKKIAEARVLIGSHLIMVEKIYHDAINKLELSKKGIKAVPAPVLTLE